MLFKINMLGIDGAAGLKGCAAQMLRSLDIQMLRSLDKQESFLINNHSNRVTERHYL